MTTFTVPSGGRYVLWLPPGRYLLTNDGPVGPDRMAPTPVLVRPGELAHLDLPDRCI